MLKLLWLIITLVSKNLYIRTSAYFFQINRNSTDSGTNANIHTGINKSYYENVSNLRYIHICKAILELSQLLLFLPTHGQIFGNFLVKLIRTLTPSLIFNTHTLNTLIYVCSSNAYSKVHSAICKTRSKARSSEHLYQHLENFFTLFPAHVSRHNPT